MKKLLLVILAFILCLSFASCNKSEDNDDSTTDANTTAAQSSAEQTTAEQTTDEQTTAEQTTAEQTTAEQTTAEITTAEQTTAEITTEAESTEPAEPEYSDEQLSMITGVPVVDKNNFFQLGIDKFEAGKDGSVAITTFHENTGIMKVANNATDFTYESRAVRFIGTEDPLADYRANLYAMFTISFCLPEEYKTNTDLWIDETNYMYISLGDNESAVAVTSVANASAGSLIATPGKWMTYTIAVTDLNGGSFGFITEKGTTIYIANCGITIQRNLLHEQLIKDIAPLPENMLYAIDVCEYDENGKETKRNMFPGNATSVELIVIDEDHELIEFANHAADYSYESRSARFMGDPIADYRNQDCYLSIDIYVPEEYATNSAWRIDEHAYFYLAIGNNATEVAITDSDNAEEGDIAVTPGQWIHYEISMSDLNNAGGSFGIYTQCNTTIYYGNLCIYKK